MALQTASPPAAPSPQVVANAFVEQYYHILHHSPDLVYRFYQDSSVLNRPNPDGGMSSVTTMQAINEKILSFDYKSYKAEIKSADAQESHKGGVFVLVTGCLTGKDNLRRKFVQAFFLAPQENGYFVLNDVFRYLDDDEPSNKHPVDNSGNVGQASSVPEPDSYPVLEPSAADRLIPVEDKPIVENDVASSEVPMADEKETVVEPQYAVEVSEVVESDSSLIQEDAPKKSYASIVKVPKGTPGATKMYVPTNITKGGPKKTEMYLTPVGSTTPAPAPQASTQETVVIPESSDAQEEAEAEGYSIYVRNLPFNTMVPQLEAEFKKFGPIKKDGVQVRNNKQQGYCFGFVEFLSQSSMHDAIQASPMKLLGREAVIEPKRTTARADSERGRYSSSRVGHLNESFRRRGNYGGGRGLGYRSWGSEPSGRGRGSSRRGENFHPIRGRGRSSSSGGPNTTLTETGSLL